MAALNLVGVANKIGCGYKIFHARFACGLFRTPLYEILDTPLIKLPPRKSQNYLLDQKGRVRNSTFVAYFSVCQTIDITVSWFLIASIH